MNKSKLIISMGDPAGVGPEIIVKARMQRSVIRSARILVTGDARVMQKAATVCGSKLQVREYAVLEDAWNAPQTVLPVVNAWPMPKLPAPGHWTEATGMASLAAVHLAVELIGQGQADALVTAPICKEAWHAAGANIPGHTELLAKLTGSRRYAMMFVGGPFRLVLATIHEPLARVAKLLTPDRIAQTATLAVRELQQRFGIAHPRLAVAGFNPHAGEGGLFGTEEARAIVPAIKQLKKNRDFSVAGPFPPDTMFAEALKGQWDLLVCMYHDQGLIPFKMLAMHTGVNVTAGLPIIRTSPDHGTAFDLAGTGKAGAGSMTAAILCAVDMVRYEQKGKNKHTERA
jgi:4-hydroxythreonine-4-phosphate dehydrogenase